MRVGVIGCGFFAQNHLNGWRDLAAEGVEIAAVCDIDASKAEAAAKAFGVPRAYADAATMLAKEKLDFVDIVTRMESHLEMVKLAAPGASTSSCKSRSRRIGARRRRSSRPRARPACGSRSTRIFAGNRRCAS